MVSSTNHLSQLRNTSFFHHRPETASAETHGDNIAPVWPGSGACFLCSLRLWSLPIVPYKIPNTGSWGCVSVGQFMALLYKTQGGFCWLPGVLQTNIHLSTREPRTELAETASTHNLKTGGGPMPGLTPWARLRGSCNCLACRYMEHFSVLCCQSQSAPAPVFTKIPGSNSALSCLPVALIKFNKTIIQPKRV